MDMPFIGKWSLATAARDAVYADPSSGQLMVGTAPAAAQARFNAYGTPASCILQATGGKYVAATTQGGRTTFAATLARGASPATFAITAGSGNQVSVTWQGPPAQAWSDAKGALAAGSGPGAQFAQTIVTPGLDQLAPQSGMDMSWVYLAGLDLTSLLQLSGVDLTGAGLAGADLSAMSLDQAILTGADLSGAKLGMATLGSATLQNAVLTGAYLNGAVMNGIQANGAILSGASAKGVSLNNASLRGAKLIGTNLSGFGSSIVQVDFTGADLTSAVFTAASVRTLTLIDANLTGVQLSNPPTNPSIVLSDATVSAKTNLTRAHLQYVDLSGHDLSHVLMTHADLTGSKLDNTKLIGAEMGYVNLTKVTMTGNIPMFGANLSNATMTGANLAGAQLGSISVLFRVVDDSSGQQAYTAFLNALNAGDPTGVIAAFKAAGVTLTAPVSVLASPSAPGRVWTVSAAQSTYTIRLETINAIASLATYQPQTAAVLVNAYMKDAILTSANLYNVSASGVQLYGKALLDGQAILEG
ncbi:MAG: pentapeptide repeat-containing protein, partial [Streptosporangiaceae bacterium]